MEEAKLETLIEICRRFNERGVKYVLCGAFASVLHGVERVSKQHRPTKDYDFIVEGSRENVRKIRDALRDLFPQIKELEDDEFEKYSTIQIVEEKGSLILDLIVKMWDIDYNKASRDVVLIEYDDIEIPVLSIDNLIQMKKDSYRPQDRFDTYWLMKIRGK